MIPNCRLVVDRSWRRPGGGNVVIAGSPLRLFRLTDAGRQVAEHLEAGSEELPEGHDRLTERLLEAGAVHPQYGSGTPWSTADVTVVIPTYQPDPERLAALVASCGDVAKVIVVDDASPEPVAEMAGATLLRRAGNGGPSAARDDARALADTPLVAFVDDDVTLPPGWMCPLLPYFNDPQVGLAAPRVRSATGSGLLAGYDGERSPLDLGPEPARIRAGTRVAYVPAAALVVRREALDSIGGFDPSLRFGEDVDLVWRLDENGWRCRYEPAAVVHHAPRTDLVGWLRQRYQYGTSAAPLAIRHSGALAPVRMSGWSLGVWGLVVAGHPVLGAALAGGTTVALRRKLLDVPDAGREALALAGLGHLYAGRQLASGITRAWWPLVLVASLVSRRARRVALASAAVTALPRPLRLLDDMAYGAGLWHGAWRHRTVAPLLPAVTSFPGRSPGQQPVGDRY